MTLERFLKPAPALAEPPAKDDDDVEPAEPAIAEPADAKDDDAEPAEPAIAEPAEPAKDDGDEPAKDDAPDVDEAFFALEATTGLLEVEGPEEADEAVASTELLAAAAAENVPVGVFIGAKRALDEEEEDQDRPLMDVVHWTNPYGDEAVAPAQSGEVCSCATPEGKIRMLRGEAVCELDRSVSASPPALSDVVPCSSHAGKLWVIVVVSLHNEADDDVAGALRSVAERNGMIESPFFVGKAAGLPELLAMWRCEMNDRHKPKRFVVDGGTCDLLTVAKGGPQPLKLIETLRGFMARCSATFGNLTVETASGEEDDTDAYSYDEALDVVSVWGVQKFTSFVEDAKYKKHKGQKLSTLEDRCLVSKATLMEVVKLREDAGDYVFYMGTEKQSRACPLSFAEGSTDAAKQLDLVLWEPAIKNFRVLSVQEWLDTEEHLISALLLLGVGGAGKSKLIHMLSAELCQAYDAPCYIFAKAIDPLGMLSHTGEVRKSAVLALTDFKFRTARKGDLDGEDLKNLLDVVEGGSIPETRYRPAVFPEGLCRIVALNGDSGEFGRWFRNYGQNGIGDLCEMLADIRDLKGTAAKLRNLQMEDPEVLKWLEAKRFLSRLSADEQAAARRVCVGFVGDSPLVTEHAVHRLRAKARAKAAEGRARRARATD